MQMERPRRIRSPEWISDDGAIVRAREADHCSATATHSTFNGIHNTSPATPSSSSGGLNFIEHRVSKMDTLAGVAIKYGVEIADIKRMNGLVTDLQMFAHKFLQIPLPGRHPPSPVLSNGSAGNGEASIDQTPTRRSNTEVLDSLQSFKSKPPLRRISPAMSSLQGYYGLSPAKNGVSEGMEMAVYSTRRVLSLEDDPLPRTSPASDPAPGRHRKSRSLVNGLHDENGKLDDATTHTESERSNKKSMTSGHQNTNGGSPSPAPELLIEDNGSTFSSGRTVKGLALRNKSASKVGLSSDAETGRLNGVPNGGDPLLGDGFLSVRKSSSTSNLQDSESNGSSLWPTSKWNLKPDLQALSTAAIARPIFDGLPKPMAVRKKAALD